VRERDVLSFIGDVQASARTGNRRGDPPRAAARSAWAAMVACARGATWGARGLPGSSVHVRPRPAVLGTRGCLGTERVGTRADRTVRTARRNTHDAASAGDVAAWRGAAKLCHCATV
jgi:hypothetical protein